MLSISMSWLSGRLRIPCVGGLRHVLVGECDDRIGADRGLRRPRGIAAVVVVDTRAGELPADGGERRRRIEDHGPIFPLGFFEGDPAARDHLRGAAAGRDAAVGMRADHEDAARVRRERQQAFVAQAGPRLPVRWRAPSRRSQARSAGSEATASSASPQAKIDVRIRLRHVVETRLRDFALRHRAPEVDRESSACRAARPIPGRGRPERDRTVEWTAPQSDMTKPG